MNEITKVFNNPEFGEIRTVVKDNEIYFVGKDIAESLGYKDTVNALKAHVDSEDKLTWQFATSGQNRNMTII
ncbi:MAG: Bro-N domain-containing protein, partial [Varibaculum cambriense]|nr:Bro-N domain-containing protein [Varibaculum cambriense]